jgi:hypothetical protein
MNVLTTTKDNGRVVELTHGEWNAFARLALAVEGKTQEDMRYNFARFDDEFKSVSGVDFSGLFGAMLAYTQAKFRTNELQGLLDQMKAFLNEKPK